MGSDKPEHGGREIFPFREISGLGGKYTSPFPYAKY
jgi:hypothetical protein